MCFTYLPCFVFVGFWMFMNDMPLMFFRILILNINNRFNTRHLFVPFKEPEFPMSHFVVHFLYSVRGNFFICWYWYNCWPSQFELSFLNLYCRTAIMPCFDCIYPVNGKHISTKWDIFCSCQLKTRIQTFHFENFYFKCT